MRGLAMLFQCLARNRTIIPLPRHKRTPSIMLFATTQVCRIVFTAATNSGTTGWICTAQGRMRLKLMSTIAGGALALAATMSAQAQTLLTGADTAEILNAARGYGSATLTTQSNGDPQITGKIEGVTYQVYFRNCTNNTDCEDINFYLGFLDLKPSLEVINDWNYNKRFSRAYLDPDDDACIEMDVDLVQGVTAEYLDSQFGLWNLVVAQFSAHVGYK